MLISRSGLQQVKAPGGGVCTLSRLGKQRTLKPNNIPKSHLNLFIIVILSLSLILTGTKGELISKCLFGVFNSSKK